MQALRLARPRVLRLVQGARTLTATANASATVAPTASSSSSSAIPLSNVEAQWEHLAAEEKSVVHKQLEELQKKDWKALSLDEKKAAYYVAFGPHGPRRPTSNPGDTYKMFGFVFLGIGAAGVLFAGARSMAPPPPRTINKEWEEAMNQRALEQKMDPITGIASEGYKGKGFVTQK